MHYRPGSAAHPPSAHLLFDGLVLVLQSTWPMTGHDRDKKSCVDNINDIFDRRAGIDLESLCYSAPCAVHPGPPV
jgi:hypothetical protein